LVVSRRPAGVIINAPGSGGGITNGGTLMIANSTVSGNTARDFKGGPGLGGGVYNAGPLEISNSTLSDNSATNGGGIWNGVTLAIGDTILNAAVGENIFNNSGAITSHGSEQRRRVI